jgi:hypothetical protein
MKEIMVTGFTLQAVSAGKLPYNPPQTAFDTMAATQSQFFATAEGERADSGKDLSVEGSLSRQDTQLTINPAVLAQDPTIVVPVTPNCPAIEVFGDIPTCQIMHEWDQEEVDTQNVRDGDPLSYWNLVQPKYRPPGNGPKDPIFADTITLDTKTYYNYNTTTFPSWCGKSATFLFWLESDTQAGGYLLARYPESNAVRPPKWYGMYVEPYGLYVYRGSETGLTGANADLPAWFGYPLEYQKKGERRHVAFVFDHVKDEIVFYLDGEYLGTKKVDEGRIAALDCNMDGPGSYTGGCMHVCLGSALFCQRL